VTTGETPPASSFEDLKLSPELLKGLYVEMKFQKPSKIQAISLPSILTPPYKDLVQIVIGTPGTIKKWMSAKKLAVNNVKILVFDEADHMLAE
ncbi:hypothetical protein UlMin_033517, partial [Ulmus minor]